MKQVEILKKVIERARNNGFDPSNYYLEGHFDNWFTYGEGRANQENTIIFSHDFAKAFWGEGDKKISLDFDQPSFGYYFDGAMDFKPRWQYHLQQMVLEENPIQYLAQFLTLDDKSDREAD